MKEDDSGLLLALRAEQRAKGAGAGARTHPHPPFLETKNQLRPLPKMPRIFSFRLQCGGEGAPCGRGQGLPRPARQAEANLTGRYLSIGLFGSHEQIIGVIEQVRGRR